VYVTSCGLNVYKPIVLCYVYYTVSCFEVKIEPPDSNDISECPHDDKPWTGMFGSYIQ